MFFFKLLLFSLSLVVFTNAAEFKNCSKPATFGNLKSIVISDCTVADKSCSFFQNKNVSMTLEFSSNQNFDKADIKVAGILGAVPVPFKLDPKDVCSYGAKCPLKKDELSKIRIELPIKSTYPKIELVVKVNLVGPDNESIVCTQFPARIV